MRDMAVEVCREAGVGWVVILSVFEVGDEKK